MPIYTCRQDGSVDVCPVTKKAWEARARLMKDECDYENVYHCLPDSEGGKWEKCVGKTLILEGNCPMFTTDGYLDWKRCNTSNLSCPNSSYVSDEVYKYPWCFGDNTPRNQTLQDILVRGPSQSFIIGIVVPMAVIIFATVFISLALVIRKRRKSLISKRVMNDVVAMKPLLSDKIEAKRGSNRVVSEGVSKLSERNVKSIIVIGGMGYLMSSTARAILEEFASRMNWNSKQCQFPHVPTTVENKTIMLLFGWFGLWNDDLCSVNTAEEVCKNIKKHVDSKPDVKVIIGISMDSYSKYKTLFGKYEVLCQNQICLDDKHIFDEYKAYFEEIKQMCKSRMNVPECPCQDMTIDMLQGVADELIGIPLKVEIISRHHDHDLIESYKAQNYDILKAMVHHFTDLEKKEKAIYEWIMYICLKGHFSRSGSFDKKLVDKIGFEIKLSSFNEHYMELSKYIRVWFCEPDYVSTDDAKYVFWHPFIYICAFHSLYENKSDIVMKHCNVNAILQLVRPPHMERSYVEVCANKSEVEVFKKRLHKLGLHKKYEDHPLLQENKTITTCTDTE